MARAKLKIMVHVLHKDIYPSFQLNSDEGKAIHKALSALAMFGAGGKDEEDKNSAKAALMQRAMAGGGGGLQGGMPQAQPPRGPIPSMAGAGGGA
jgi:hypothetical protein